ncbi:hypothetical protein ABI59_12455 [Acidobacteria bacterium Mor1]|nr:hypothetical protein ABI59_12455 [Acidobacteria bacterium Mor1]
MRSLDHLQAAVVTRRRIEVDAQGQHLLEEAPGCFDVRYAGLDRRLGELRAWQLVVLNRDRRVLVQWERPTSLRGLVEEQSPHQARTFAEQSSDQAQEKGAFPQVQNLRHPCLDVPRSKDLSAGVQKVVGMLWQHLRMLDAANQPTAFVGGEGAWQQSVAGSMELIEGARDVRSSAHWSIHASTVMPASSARRTAWRSFIGLQ